MDRARLERYILDAYSAEADCPWAEYPRHRVFRHANNRKWFALMMELSREKLGLPGDGTVDVMNIKLDPILVGALRDEAGFFPAYHMNKENWITVALDGSVPEDKIKLLLDMSFEVTAVRPKNPNK